MKNNLKEFKELIETYKSICEKIKAGDYGKYNVHFMRDMTCFSTNECSLCKSALSIMTPTHNYTGFTDKCKFCVWEQTTKEQCNDGGNIDTYLAISNASNFDELSKALENRIKRMEEVIQ